MKKNIVSFVSVLLLFLAVGCSKEDKSNVVKSYDFENGIDGWHGYGSIKTTKTQDKHHSEKSSLLIQGTSVPGPWSYAGSLRLDLEAGKRYKLTAWLLVQENGGDQAFMKAALFVDGNWSFNAMTNRISSDGQWYEVTTEFEVPTANQLEVEIDIEKRPHDKSIASVFYLDDVRIQALN